MTSLNPETSLDDLRKLTGRPWSHLASAALSAEKCKDTIAKAVNAKGLIPPDTALVAFGSLARNERTQGSDCDWTLLVDGLANGDHHRCAAHIAKAVKDEGLPVPGATGIFGSLAYSHELVHQIGGEDDTNRNTTRRILLLLESTAIAGGNSDLVRRRVIRQVINRYLEHEPDLLLPQGVRRVPRFLLNDIVRYWRTMAVDYAWKVRDRHGQGWALRNIKLRLSRKLTFVSGMLTCFDCVLCPEEVASEKELFKHEDTRVLSVQEHILRCVESTPTEILARAVLNYAPDDKACAALAIELFDAYDSFLGLLDNAEHRKALDGLATDKADDHKVFQHARSLGKQFQAGLIHLFFESDPDLTKMTQEYGVF